MPRFPLGQG